MAGVKSSLVKISEFVIVVFAEEEAMESYWLIKKKITGSLAG